MDVAAADSLTVSDAAARSAAVSSRPVVDSFSLSDSASRGATSTTRLCMDALVVTDTLGRTTTTVRPVMDAFVVMDVLGRLTSSPRGAVDLFAIVDSATAVETSAPFVPKPGAGRHEHRPWVLAGTGTLRIGVRLTGDGWVADRDDDEVLLWLDG